MKSERSCLSRYQRPRRGVWPAQPCVGRSRQAMVGVPGRPCHRSSFHDVPGQDEGALKRSPVGNLGRLPGHVQARPH